MTQPVANKLPKGSFAIAHKQSIAYHLHTGAYHYSRYFIVRVASADRDGRVKTFVDSEHATPERVDSKVTIYSLPPQHLASAETLFARQKIDFIGYRDKEHLRLCLVNAAIAEAAD